MSKYSDLIIYQYRNKPKARDTMNLLMGEVDRVLDNLLDLSEQWDIDKARGFSLDIIGRRVGVSRTLPSFVSKGYFSYFGAVGGKPWGEGKWYRKGDSTGDAIKLIDEDFRFLIKAKIYKNFQDDTLDYVLSVMRELLSDNVNIKDNYDMTATIYLPLQSMNSLQTYMIQVMDILPRPVGVMYNYLNASGKEFGFDGFFNSFGFGEGRFIDS